MASCRPAVPASPQRAELAIGIGIESLQDPSVDWSAVSALFDDAHVGGFSLAVGRPEWTAFPWDDRPTAWAAKVTADDDRVETALSALAGDPQRRVTLTVDVLAPERIADDPHLAGVFADGDASSSFPSATALRDGPVGTEIIELCTEIAQRYQPDRIALTELIGDAFFSPADEALFAQMTGAEGFPRRQGRVDIEDAQVTAWLSTIITDLILHCAEAVAPFGVGIEMDARVQWDDLGQDRPDSGHLYDELLATGAHLTLWAYTGLREADPALTADLAGALERRFSPQQRARIAISVGLWGPGQDPVTAASLETAVDGAARGVASVLVTPLSLLGKDHWRAMPYLSGW